MIVRLFWSWPPKTFVRLFQSSYLANSTQLIPNPQLTFNQAILRGLLKERFFWARQKHEYLIWCRFHSPRACFFYRIGWWDQICFCLFFLCIFCRKCVRKRFCYLCNVFWYLNPTIAQKSQKYYYVIRGAITFRTCSIFSAVLWWPTIIDNFSF